MAEGPCRALPHLEELSVQFGWRLAARPSPYLGRATRACIPAGILPGAFLLQHRASSCSPAPPSQAELAFEGEAACRAFLEPLGLAYTGPDNSSIDCRLSLAQLPAF